MIRVSIFLLAFKALCYQSKGIRKTCKISRSAYLYSIISASLYEPGACVICLKAMARLVGEPLFILARDSRQNSEVPLSRLLMTSCRLAAPKVRLISSRCWERYSAPGSPAPLVSSPASSCAMSARVGAARLVSCARAASRCEDGM